ncbi:related to Regulatory protein alcR [Ustilago sp. UG-2017b]|nr:related to Regulatory protein alcR [Ustilago sp. UG-2017b]
MSPTNNATNTTAEASTCAAAGGAGAARSRKKMYKNCDRCRQAKRACSAQYVSIAEALASKVACTNCKKKGQVCTFNSLINSFGGIPLGGLTGAAFAESLQSQLPAIMADESMEAAMEESSEGAKRRRESVAESIGNVDAVFEVLNNTSSQAGGEEGEERDSKRSKQSNSTATTTFADFADFDHATTSSYASSAGPLVRSRAQSPFTANGTSPFDVLGFDIWNTAPSVRLAQSSDQFHLNTDLLNVYEGAAESAFRVWVTDATTPYLLSSSALCSSFSPPSSSASMALNKKVCLLDHASKRIFKPDNANRNVEKRVSEAYHAVLLAYAAQWPRHRSGEAGGGWRPDEARIRLSLWKQARDKLMDAADAWSFRIVFALILFAWTEKPREVPDNEAFPRDDPSHDHPSQLHVPSLDENSALDSGSWQIPAEASTMMLATAMRKLKAFRLKIQQLRRKGIDLWSTEEPGLDPTQVAHRRVEATLLENTYHNLYWFGCMMDTELSVLRKYDAVIGDEDAELTDQLLSTQPSASETDSFLTSDSTRKKPLRKIWDEVIPANSKSNMHTFAKSWPCSEEEAKRTLAYATPIKVLLFRHVGRLQSSYWRQAPAEQIERQITHVLSVVRHWDETFAPFFASCIAHHSELPPSIQSWHVITATKWNLAAILLVELVSTMDRSASDPFNNTDQVFASLRSKVCNQTAALIYAIQHSSLASSMAKAGSPSSFDFIEATNSTILHSDPWPEISVHGFACVAKSEIKAFAGWAREGRWEEVKSAEERVEKCIWALKQLSNRSIMAVDAGVEVRKLLDLHSPLKQQQQRCEQEVAEVGLGRKNTSAIESFLADASTCHQGGAEGEVPVLPDDVWQSCWQILNEGGAAADSGANLSVPVPTQQQTYTPSGGEMQPFWTDLDLDPTSSPHPCNNANANQGFFLTPTTLPPKHASSEVSDASSSKASSNHSLSPPLTTATLGSLDYGSSVELTPPSLGGMGMGMKEGGGGGGEEFQLPDLSPFQFRVA